MRSALKPVWAEVAVSPPTGRLRFAAVHTCWCRIKTPPNGLAVREGPSSLAEYWQDATLFQAPEDLAAEQAAGALHPALCVDEYA